MELSPVSIPPKAVMPQGVACNDVMGLELSTNVTNAIRYKDHVALRHLCSHNNLGRKIVIHVGTHCSCWKAELFCGLEMGALDAIVRQGHCEHIITPGDESQTIGYWAVHIAAATGNEPALNLLVDTYGGLHATTRGRRVSLLDLALLHHHDSIVEVILRRGFRLDQLPKDSEHFTKAFLSVVTKGSIQSMNYWVRAGINLSDIRVWQRAMCEAIRHNQCSVVEYLLQASRYNLQTVTQTGDRDYLHMAKTPDMAACLVSHGADPNQLTKDGSSALLFAAARGDDDTCEWLLAHGANPTLTNDDGVTSLWNAVSSCRLIVVLQILRTNVDPNVRCRGIRIHSDSLEHMYDIAVCPLLRAVHLRLPSIAQALVSYGVFANAERHRNRAFDEYRVLEDWQGENLRWFNSVCSQPPNLAWWSKRCIRRHLPIHPMESVNSLNLSSAMKKYILGL